MWELAILFMECPKTFIFQGVFSKIRPIELLLWQPLPHFIDVFWNTQSLPWLNPSLTFRHKRVQQNLNCYKEGFFLYFSKMYNESIYVHNCPYWCICPLTFSVFQSSNIAQGYGTHTVYAKEKPCSPGIFWFLINCYQIDFYFIILIN